MDLEWLLGFFLVFAVAGLYMTALLTMPLPNTRTQFVTFIIATAVPPVLWFRAACQPRPATVRPWNGFLGDIAATGLIFLIFIFTQTAVSAIAVNPMPVSKLLAVLIVFYGPATIPWARLGWEQIRRVTGE